MISKPQPTLETDLVLIHFEDVPMVFARVEEITADHKKAWYQVKLLILAVPLQVVTWILKEEYINGGEFTMDGKRVHMEKVLCPDGPRPELVESLPASAKSLKKEKSPAKPSAKDKPAGKGRVIAFPKKDSK